MKALRQATVVASLAVVALTACETDQPTAKEREEVTPLVRRFLLQLATAYATLDAAPLKEVGAPRLIEQARRDIDLLRAGGDRLEPLLVSLEITDLKVVRHANAYAVCTEVWDTRRYDATTDRLVGHDPHSVLHSRIQLKKIKGAWLVLYREVEETATGPRLALPTKDPR